VAVHFLHSPDALQQVNAAAAQLEEQGSELPNMPPPRELSDSICCLLVWLAGRPCSLLPKLELADEDFAAASSRPGVLITSLLRSDELCTGSSTICSGIDRADAINTPCLILMFCSGRGRHSAAVSWKLVLHAAGSAQLGALAVDEMSDDASSASTDTLSRWSSGSDDGTAACAGNGNGLVATAASDPGKEHHVLQAVEVGL
jgi:hypothetical protein